MDKEFSDILRNINSDKKYIDIAMNYLHDKNHVELASEDINDLLFQFKCLTKKYSSLKDKFNVLLLDLDKDRDGLINSIVSNIRSFVDATNACSVYNIDWFISLNMSIGAKVLIAQELIYGIKPFNKTNKLWEGIIEREHSFIQQINSLDEDI